MKQLNKMQEFRDVHCKNGLSCWVNLQATSPELFRSYPLGDINILDIFQAPSSLNSTEQ